MKYSHPLYTCCYFCLWHRWISLHYSYCLWMMSLLWPSNKISNTTITTIFIWLKYINLIIDINYCLHACLFGNILTWYQVLLAGELKVIRYKKFSGSILTGPHKIFWSSASKYYIFSLFLKFDVLNCHISIYFMTCLNIYKDFRMI